MKQKYLIFKEGNDCVKSIRIAKTKDKIPKGYSFIDLSESTGMFLPGQTAWKEVKQ